MFHYADNVVMFDTGCHYFFAVHKGSVSGIKVFHDIYVAGQEYLAVMSGNSGVVYGNIVIRLSADSNRRFCYRYFFYNRAFKFKNQFRHVISPEDPAWNPSMSSLLCLLWRL